MWWVSTGECFKVSYVLCVCFWGSSWRSDFYVAPPPPPPGMFLGRKWLMRSAHKRTPRDERVCVYRAHDLLVMTEGFNGTHLGSHLAQPMSESIRLLQFLACLF